MASIRSTWCTNGSRPSRRPGTSWSVAALTLVCVAAIGCRGQSDRTPAALLTATLPPRSLRLEFDRPVALSDEGVLVTVVGTGPTTRLTAAGRRRQFIWPLSWGSGQEFQLDLTVDGRVYSVKVAAPPATQDVIATLEIPAGQESVALGARERSEAAVAEDGFLGLGVTIENWLHGAVEYELLVTLSEGVAHGPPAPAWVRDERSARLAGNLYLEHDYRQEVCPLTLDPNVARADVTVTLRWRPTNLPEQGAAAPPFETATTIVSLRRATRHEIASALEVVDVLFPADPLGQRQIDRQPDTVVLPSPWWRRLRAGLHPGREWVNPYDAYAHHAVWLRNRADYPLHLLIESDVVAHRDASPDTNFAPPRWAAPRESSVSEHLLRVAPQETAAASVACFVRPEVAAGRYVRRFRVFALGDTKPLAEFSRPLVVMRGDSRVAATVAAGLLVAMFTWLAALWRGPALVRRIGVDGLSTIGLLSAVQFVVSYASRIGSDLLAGALGPFNVLVTGVGHEGLTSLVAAALVTLLPYPGAYMLSAVSLFALNGIFSGQLGLVDVLFVSVGIGLTELLLAVTGVTTGGALAPAESPRPGVLWRLALAIGVANALTLAVQFSLFQVLHRLYFAPWFVGLVSLWTGLLYGGVGAAVGGQWGFRLRRVLR